MLSERVLVDMGGNLPQWVQGLLNVLTLAGFLIPGGLWLQRKQRQLADLQTAYQQLHRDVVSHQQTETQLRQQVEGERLISTIAQQIRRSLDLHTILSTTVAEVRTFLKTDRVFILQFNPDWSASVTVESVGNEWTSILDMTFQDPCLSKLIVEKYKGGDIQAVANLASSGFAPCYLELLTQFQVKAQLVAPIFQENLEFVPTHEPDDHASYRSTSYLWGLLIVHHCVAPREWEALEIALMKQLTDQVAIALQQSELYTQLRQLNTNLEEQVLERTLQLQQALDCEGVSRRITNKVRDSLDEGQILQTALHELARALSVDYCCAALYNSDRSIATVAYEYERRGQSLAVGQTLPVKDVPHVHRLLLEGHHFEYYEPKTSWLFRSAQSGDLACPVLHGELAAKLLCPVRDEGHTLGYLGVIHYTSRRFNPVEVQLVQQVANQCAIALRQSRLYQAAQEQVRELAKLNQLKDEFLSTISHELRTPISNMNMAIHMLKMASLPDRLQKYLNILRSECNRETELINDLLNLQQLEAGLFIPSPTPLALKDWLLKRFEAFQEKVQKRMQQLDVALPDVLPSIVIDAAVLERVLSELLTNACKYTPSGGAIAVHVMAQPVFSGTTVDAMALITIDVCNQAEVPAIEATKIFDKFYRIPNTDPWKEGGTGLGLALVRLLVKQLNGTIYMASRDGWTSFQLEIMAPIAPADP